METIINHNQFIENKNQYVEYCERYVVLFWLENKDIWNEIRQTYYCKKKNMHAEVINHWKNEYKKQKKKFISITYQ